MGLFNNIKKAFTGLSQGWGSGWSIFSTGSPSNLTKKELVRQYKNYVYPAVRAIAESVAKIEFKLFEQGKNEIREIKNHEILDMLYNPNPDMTSFQFQELSQTILELVGESYW